jgi:hypothetical protein
MDLEQLKAAWQREKAAHARSIDAEAIMAETREKAMKMDQEFVRQQRVQIICGLFCLVLLASGYRREGPLLVNAGLIVMLLGLALMLAGSIILKFRLRQSHPELPREEYLAEQRKKIEARIALLRRNTRWFFIPSMAGFLMWQMGLSHSLEIAVALVILVALASAGMLWFYRWKLRKDLLPILEEIDRELSSYRDHSESRQE